MSESADMRDAWKIAEYDRLRKIALHCRAAQNNYFRTKSPTALQEARDWERRLDKELATPELAPIPRQLSLLEDLP